MWLLLWWWSLFAAATNVVDVSDLTNSNTIADANASNVTSNTITGTDETSAQQNLVSEPSRNSELSQENSEQGPSENVVSEPSRHSKLSQENSEQCPSENLVSEPSKNSKSVTEPPQNIKQSPSDKSEQMEDKAHDPSSKSTLFLYSLYPLVVGLFFLGVLRFYLRKKKRDGDRIRMQILDEQDASITPLPTSSELQGDAEISVPRFWISSVIEVEVRGLNAYVQRNSRTANWLYKDNSITAIWALADRGAHDDLRRRSIVDRTGSDESIRSKRKPISGLFFATVSTQKYEEDLKDPPGVSGAPAPEQAPPALPPPREPANDADDITHYFVKISNDEDDSPLKAVANKTLSMFNPLANTYSLLRLSARENNASASAKQTKLLERFKHVSFSDNKCSFELPRLEPTWGDYGVQVRFI